MLKKVTHLKPCLKQRLLEAEAIEYLSGLLVDILTYIYKFQDRRSILSVLKFSSTIYFAYVNFSYMHTKWYVYIWKGRTPLTCLITFKLKCYSTSLGTDICWRVIKNTLMFFILIYTKILYLIFYKFFIRIDFLIFEKFCFKFLSLVKW